MKKYFSFAAAIVAMLAMVASTGCSDDKTGETGPVIEVAPTLTISAVGGTSQLTYSIINPVQGQQISASCDQDWINSFDYSTEGQIGFKYAAYEDEENDRTATLTLTYPGAETKTVTVTQIRKGGMSFDIQVSDVTEAGVTVTITPSNNDQTYMYAIVSADYVNSFDTDEAFIEDDVRYWEEYCDEQGFSFESFMDVMLRKGVYTDAGVNDLEQNKEYCAYAYGLTREGVVTSGLGKAFFSTTKIDYVNVEFELTYTNDTKYDAAIKVSPKLDGKPYEGKWIFTARNSYALTVNGETDEEFQESIMTNLKEQVASGMFTEDDLIVGEYEFNLSDAMGTTRVWEGNTYYIYCFGLNENFNVNTNEGVFTKCEVETAPVEVTNNCTFDVEVTDIEDVEARVNVTPSDKEVTYFIGLTPTHTIGLAGEGDEERGEALVVERLLQRIQIDWGVVDWSSEEWVERGDQSELLHENLTWLLEPEQELTVLVFGFNQGGRRITEIGRADFTTLKASESTKNFSVDIEVIENDEPGKLVVQFTPKTTDPDWDPNTEWYYTGILPAYQWDEYGDNNWQAFVSDMEHANGGSLDASSIVRGPKPREAEVNFGVEYVLLAIPYKYGVGITRPNEMPFTERVTSAPLPESKTADLEVEVQRYSGTALEEMYPTEWKGASESGDYVVALLPKITEETVTWYYFLHASRSSMDLPDGLIYKYFMDQFMGYRGGDYGTYSPGGRGPWGLFYTAVDITGAWGPMHYDEVDLDTIALSDPADFPTGTKGLWLPEYYGPAPEYPENPNPGFDGAATTSVHKSRKISFDAPVRFSSVSFLQAASEIEQMEARVNDNREEHSVVDLAGFDKAQIGILK